VNIEQNITNRTIESPKDKNTFRQRLYKTDDVYFMYAPIININCTKGMLQREIVNICITKGNDVAFSNSTKMVRESVAEKNNIIITMKKLKTE
jgi:hypothetical protein